MKMKLKIEISLNTQSIIISKIILQILFSILMISIYFLIVYLLYDSECTFEDILKSVIHSHLISL
jgi:hypothetical protein